MRRPLILVAAAGMAAGLVGTGPLAAAVPTKTTKTTVTVSEFDFGIKQKPTKLKHGKVSFAVKNIGTFEHKYVVVRWNQSTPLPTKADGSVDEAAIPAADHIGDIASLKPKQSGSLKARLDAGQYVAFCNIVETIGTTTFVHYARGMTKTFKVT